MQKTYAQSAKLLKALADPNRLMIVDMLSCGELCACKILEEFQIAQPTLSHHMKILCSCGLVTGRKEGKWIHYSLNQTAANQLKEFMGSLMMEKENCICKETGTFACDCEK